ncbi:MAG: 3-hydroxyacyl-ACP dehydratase FabZ [Bacteroidales bacterium]
MNREEIKEFLPHREPMLLVDEMEFTKDNHVVGKYHVRGDEFFLQGHFPGHPTVPGVIICEIMGQCSSLLVKDKMKGKTPLYTTLDKVRFRAPVHPGDTIVIKASLVANRSTLYFIDAQAYVGDKLCTEGKLSVALVDNKKLTI